MRNDDPIGNFDLLMATDKAGSPEDRERGRQRILAMPYEQFLGTEYWKIIRLRVLFEGNYRCHYCGAPAVNAHHLTYENHGAEHLHLDDLVPVCRKCHTIVHGGGTLPERRYAAMTSAERDDFYEQWEQAKQRLAERAAKAKR